MAVYPCHFQDCAFTTKRKPDLLQHERQHTGECPYTCTILDCTRAFATRPSLAKHVLAHANPLRGEFSCAEPGCLFLGGSLGVLTRHAFQSGHAALACPLPNCGLRFKNQTAVNYHKRSPAHMGEGGRPLCRTCSIIFDTDAEYRAHVREHRMENLNQGHRRAHSSFQPPPSADAFI